MSSKSFGHLSPSCLLSLTLILCGLTPKVLSAQEIEPGKTRVDATLSEHNPPILTASPLSTKVDDGEARRMISNTARDTSSPTPLLRGEGSQAPPFPGREGGLGGLGQPYPSSIEMTSTSHRLGEELAARAKITVTEATTPVSVVQVSPDVKPLSLEPPPISTLPAPDQPLPPPTPVKTKIDVETATPISLAQVSPDVKPPSLEPPLEQRPLPTLPAPDQLLPLPTQQPKPEPTPEGIPATLIVKRFEFVGNTVFSSEELAKELAEYTNRRISFAELLQARSQITKFYTDHGYVTSGAIIPPQNLKTESTVVKLQVVEGTLENINVTGTRRLRPGYVSSRLAVAAGQPLNINRLVEGLQLLQLDPLIKNLSADLQGGTRLGTNILEVKVAEADTFSSDITLDNSRSPSVGTMRRRVALNEANLLGFGDSLSLGYTNTDGSNGGDISYTLPVNPHNGKVSLNFGITNSNVIERPFERLDISSKSRYYEATFRQPIIQTPSQELELGLTFSHQQSQTFLGIEDIGPYPLAAGADDKGRTRVSAVRFFQQWTQRSNQQVLAFRSQFSFGLDVLDATINNNGEPDSRFFSWQGQGQWARQLAPDTLFLLRANAQLSDSRLLGLEQFALGGQDSVRGYRQDVLLKDNGLLASAEVRLPILRVPKIGGLLQVAPFIDVGMGWNHSGTPPTPNIPNTLVSMGLGLLWRQGNNLTVRLNYGIPLVSTESKGNTLQENGLYFSINYTPF